jgi:hypothetical protein
MSPVLNKPLGKPGTRAYMDAMMALPAWQDWSAQAQAETWITASAGDSGTHMRLGVAGGSRHAATRACPEQMEPYDR